MSDIREPIEVPAGCVDPTVGRRYWQFTRTPEAFTDCRERVALMRHTVVCPACLTKVLDLYEAGEIAKIQPRTAE